MITFTFEIRHYLSRLLISTFKVQENHYDLPSPYRQKLGAFIQPYGFH